MDLKTVKTSVASVAATAALMTGVSALSARADAAAGKLTVQLDGSRAKVESAHIYVQEDGSVTAEVYGHVPQENGVGVLGAAGPESFVLTGQAKADAMRLLNGPLLDGWRKPRGLQPEP